MTQPDEGPDDVERVSSPPTDRVVAIVGLLADQQQPSSVASIASRLELNRATVTSILLTLERAGWVVRQPDRRYLLGPGLMGVAHAVRALWPVSPERTHLIEQLSERVDCGVALALVGATEISFLTVVGGQGQIPAAVGVGVRLPLVAPAGAAVIAHRDAHARRRWLGTAPVPERQFLGELLDQAKNGGVVVFGMGQADPAALDVLAEVAGMLAEHPRRAALRQRVLQMLTGVGGNPYTAEELGTSDPLSVSYLAAPVLDKGEAVYELQLGPLQNQVSAPERDRYIREIRATAAQLSS
ncbi:helix-turn-helix domain-containing protein [[Mycobacterium] nativiensis]|uniref:Helix-turn-helix domain-containing protein n=1 Tax=[Mycobacterium] nativiensis TaxID=2855503 RepID=A0ABU5Y208_9MYCO|nr:helix-turn-helix domain-containing protein [Mycolicibacter sp. MYC340]MEB3034276.1 helix-turn-helix domain-containing protein [Mycolicibacter sp. MYC340]